MNFAIEAIILFVKSMKEVLSGMFTLLVSRTVIRTVIYFPVLARKHLRSILNVRKLVSRPQMTGDRMHWTCIIWAVYFHIKGGGGKVRLLCPAPLMCKPIPQITLLLYKLKYCIFIIF